MRGDRVYASVPVSGHRGVPLDKGIVMKKALLCATAAAGLVSVGATAHAQEGWYGIGKVGAVVDGIQDIDATSSNNGQIDSRLTPNVDPVFGLGLGYGFDTFRLEGVLSYRNNKMDVPDTFIGIKPAATVGPNGAGSTRVTNLMVNAIKDFDVGGSIKPYLGLGVGAARVDTRVSSLYDINTGGPANGFDDSDTAFAWNALAGFGIKVSEQLTVDIGYTYTAAQDLNYTGFDGDYESRWY